jgi:DNA-binding FadR family transcriptional regulator
MAVIEETYALAQKLEDEITRYGLQSGWRLPSEEKLALMHGVNRGAIRAAIAVLRERGLVASRRGGGTFVASPDIDTVAGALRGYVGRTETDKAFDELLHLRTLVEGECARELATKRRKEALTRLQESYAEMVRRVEQPAAFAKADFNFHRVLVNESGNGIFRAIMSALSGVFEDYARHSHTVVGDRRARVLSEHEAILEAIQQGDGDAAAHLASAHIQRSKAALKAVRAKA